MPYVGYYLPITRDVHVMPYVGYYLPVTRDARVKTCFLGDSKRMAYL